MSKGRIGTASDTPTSLRAKAAEFKKMALTARDAEIVEELDLLARRYAERADELEKALAGASPVVDGKSLGDKR